MLTLQNIDALIRTWERKKLDQLEPDIEEFIGFGKQAIKLGQPALAFDILSEALNIFPNNKEIRYLSALALVKSGSTSFANSILCELLVDMGNDDPLYTDTVSLVGRVEKDRWSRLTDGDERQAAGEQAYQYYQQAFNFSHDFFPGINAATMAALTGRVEDAKRLAGEVVSLCMTALAKSSTPDYWVKATLGEASILLDDKVAAITWYGQAGEHAEKHYGDLASMRRQLKLLARNYELAKLILQKLVITKVAVFSGHMIDKANRESPRFPAAIEAKVADAIEKAIVENNIGIGYCSAACGADILFIEKMLNMGAEINIVLPFKKEDFLKTSVEFAGQNWVNRFNSVLSQAASVSYCTEEDYLNDEVMFTHAELLVQGLAILRAQQLETDVTLLTVLDSQGKAEAGGTEANLAHWQKNGHQSIVLDLNVIRGGALVPQASGSVSYIPVNDQVSGTEPSQWSRRQICTMLFADMVGYSKILEHETPRFFIHFLNVISREIEASAVKPSFKNSWGDGLFLVFEDAEVAADFALRLRDAVVKSDWENEGLPKEMNIRIGMHTGPVFRAFDPIIQRENYFGSHVTMAARIEPVAIPGSVFVSEQMAAVLAASGCQSFACDYQGQQNLAKKYGTFKPYRLRRFNEVE